MADETARVELRGDLDGLAREGARRMLAAAPEAEVEDGLAAYAAERDERGRRLVVRNGHARERQVTTVAAGPVPLVILPPWCRKSPKVATTVAGVVEVIAPWINDKRVDADTAQRVRFRSVTLSPWCRKSPKVVEVLPLLYLHGLLSGDFVQRWRPEPVLRRRA